MNYMDNTNEKAGKILHDLHAYCFCSQPTWRAMGYSFSEGDFSFLHELIEGQTAEIEMLKHDRKKLKKEFLSVKYEAVKEYAEKIKLKLEECRKEYNSVMNPDGACAMLIAKSLIDKLLVEMGVSNESEGNN